MPKLNRKDLAKTDHYINTLKTINGAIQKISLFIFTKKMVS